MALNTAAIATEVSKLKLTGVRIRDQDEIPVQVYDRDCPTMYPSPKGFCTRYTGSPQTFSVAGAYWEVVRVLNYHFIQAKLGTDLATTISHHKAAIANADALYELLAELDIPGVDVIGIDINVPDAMFAPGDELEPSCYGFEVLMSVRERLNA